MHKIGDEKASREDAGGYRPLKGQAVPSVLRDLRSLSGKQVLDLVLQNESPRDLVQRLSEDDFYWMVKKVGEEDCLHLLELASEEQWQYLLDVEIWQKDRIDLLDTGQWLLRLYRADPRRLVRWLFEEANDLAYFYLFKNIEVKVKGDDEIEELRDGYISLDGVLYVKVLNQADREIIEGILRTMADEDFLRYQALLTGLAGLLPAEAEEELYRLRNVRLAEHGFLPFEEALCIYTPLAPESLKRGQIPELIESYLDEEIRNMVPVAPLFHTGIENLLMRVVHGTGDPVFLDRLRMEFAGLCNQILCADGLSVEDFDDLIRVCRKAAGYLNLALERLSGDRMDSAEDVLRRNSLVSLFRVGFGLAVKVKWEAERWVSGSWFHRQGLHLDFWGEQWGGVLKGLLADRPKLYVGLEAGEEYRDFEWLSELGECMTVLKRVMALDGLLGEVVQRYSPEGNIPPYSSEALTFYPLLFNIWARVILGFEPSFSEISFEEAKRFFGLLREAEKAPPYELPGFEEAFVSDFMAYATQMDTKTIALLRETLRLIWQEFVEEYRWVSLEDLDGRYCRFIILRPDSGSAPP